MAKEKELCGKKGGLSSTSSTVTRMEADALKAGVPPSCAVTLNW